MSWFNGFVEEANSGGTDWLGKITDVFGNVMNSRSNASALEAQAAIEAQRTARLDAAAQQSQLLSLTQGTETKRTMLYVAAGLLMFALLMRQTAQAK